ncbi:unnamed protein product [Arctia plantaginis]|uniref:Uncharacterized protein n=1 Tax=Arctia plantaginis TaxID=874455 RepID=A0A8S1BPX2_ARCPL|nr:unnamed protein product [Arctia plantaginis]
MVFATKEEREKAKQKLAKKGNGLMVEEVKNKDPLVTLKDVLSVNTDEDILKALKNQNRPIFEDIAEGDDRVAVKYRRKGRNQHIGHVVLSVSPKIWKRRDSQWRIAKGVPGDSTYKVLQANLQRKKLAISEIFVEAVKSRGAVALLQEPYVGSSGSMGMYAGVRVYQNTKVGQDGVKAAIAVFDNDLTVIQYPKLTTNNIVVPSAAGRRVYSAHPQRSAHYRRRSHCDTAV